VCGNDWLHLFTLAWCFLSTCDLVRCEALGLLIRLSLNHSCVVALLVSADIADTKPRLEFKKENAKGGLGGCDRWSMLLGPCYCASYGWVRPGWLQTMSTHTYVSAIWERIYSLCVAQEFTHEAEDSA